MLFYFRLTYVTTGSKRSHKVGQNLIGFAEQIARMTATVGRTVDNTDPTEDTTHDAAAVAATAEVLLPGWGSAGRNASRQHLGKRSRRGYYCKESNKGVDYWACSSEFPHLSLLCNGNKRQQGVNPTGAILDVSIL